MAGSFIDAINKKLIAAAQQAVEKSQGLIGKARERVKSAWQQTREKIGTWQESRAKLERSKARIKRARERAARERVANEIDELQPAESPAPRNEGESRRLVRQKEFDMKVDDDPAFMAWVNRVGELAGFRVEPGETITGSRLRQLVELFGKEDPLALYETITTDPAYGYRVFQKAYDNDGKNKGQGPKEGPYQLVNAISMAMAMDEIFDRYSIYQVFA